MLKFKKILSSFICLIIVTAFSGAISLEFGSVSLTKPRIEVSQANLHSAMNLSFISEEKDDANDHQHIIALPVKLFFRESPFFISNLASFCTVFNSEKMILNHSLYISFRSLRL